MRLYQTFASKFPFGFACPAERGKQWYQGKKSRLEKTFSVSICGIWGKRAHLAKHEISEFATTTGVTLQNPFRGFDAFTHNLPHPFLLPPASLRVRPSPFPFPLLSQRFDSHPVLSLVALSSISCCKTIVNFVFWGLAVFVMLKMKLRSKMLLGIWDICYIL